MKTSPETQLERPGSFLVGLVLSGQKTHKSIFQHTQQGSYKTSKILVLN